MCKSIPYAAQSTAFSVINSIFIPRDTHLDPEELQNALVHSHGPCVLCVAAATGNVQMIQCLLELEAKPNSSYVPCSNTDGSADMNDFSHFPLELAVSNNHYEMAELLLHHRADPNSEFMAPFSFLVKAAADPTLHRFVPLLASYGATVAYPGRNIYHDTSTRRNNYILEHYPHPFPSKQDFHDALRRAGFEESQFPTANHSGTHVYGAEIFTSGLCRDDEHRRFYPHYFGV